MAQNLRDSGYDVVVGLRSGSSSRALAKKDGMSDITTIPQAVKQSDVVCFAFPDHCHGKVYRRSIAKNLSPYHTLWFLQGMSIHFRFVVPSPNHDVILIAPHAPGVAVREKYLTGEPFSAFSAVHQNPSGKAKRTVRELAEAIGIPHDKLIPTTFAREAIGDLFGEQAVLCGGLAGLIKNGFDVLVESGIPPENAYLEVAYQLDLIVELIKRYGIEGMFRRISVTARYGSIRAAEKIFTADVKQRMKELLEEITSGTFSEKLSRLTEGDIASLDKAIKKLSSPAFEKAARKHRPSSKK